MDSRRLMYVDLPDKNPCSCRLTKSWAGKKDRISSFIIRYITLLAIEVNEIGLLLDGSAACSCLKTEVTITLFHSAGVCVTDIKAVYINYAKEVLLIKTPPIFLNSSVEKPHPVR
jgi:hypothetical protein